MARKPLTPDEIQAREVEKAALNATKRGYTKHKTSATEPVNQNAMEETTQNNNVTENTVNTATEPVQTTEPVKTETVVAPTTQSGGDTNVSLDKNVYRAFSGNVKQRDYSTVKLDPNLASREIPEVEGIGGGAAAQPDAQKLLDTPTKPAETQNLAQQMQEQTGANQLSPAEQDQAATMAVDVALGFYDKLHWVMRSVGKISDRRLNKMRLNNEIDLNVEIAPETEESDSLSLGGFVKQINEDIDKTIVVSEEFKAAVRPPMERLAKKYGIGIGDGTYLAIKFGEDIAVKGAIMIGLRNTVNDVITHHSKIYKDAYAAHMEQVRKVAEAEARAAAAEKKAAAMENANNSTATVTPAVTTNPEEVKP